MMKERGLPRSLRLIFSGSVAVGLGLLAHSVQAQETKTDDAPQQMQRVEITGSSIKRVAAEGASPITTIKAEDFVKTGATTAAEVLSSISGNQTQFTSSSNVGAGKTAGSSADLRGLGANKTLVLLNGRRLANAAFDGASVDLNVIPIAALDRVEVLRDGASAVYGTDAIGGVINFITKRSYTGLNVSAEGILPQQSGGAEKRFNVSGGLGDLDKDGYNFFGVVDYHTQNAVKASDRSFAAKGGQNPGLGLNQGSANSNPANYYDVNSGVFTNPYASVGCNNPPYAYAAKGGICRYNTQATIGIVPKTEEIAVLGKGTFKLNADNTASVEYLHSESKIKVRVAPDVFSSAADDGGNTDYVINSNSRYYPGNGITPGTVSGGPLALNWRSQATGPRVSDSKNTTDRLLFSLDGTVAGWDYKTGLAYAMSKASDRLISGYLSNSLVQAGMLSGVINPFGPQDAAGNAYLHNAQVAGVYEDAKTTVTTLDFTASRELFQLPAGGVGIAFGGEMRKEKANFNVDHDIADLSQSTGSSTAQSSSGNRTVKAVFTELNIPILKGLEANIAARYDRYSDVGGTLNPKVSLRWQPSKQLLFRSTYSTGFRAPSLYELHDPNSTTYTLAAYDDPVLCPGGTPVANGNPSRDCGQQFFRKVGGNTSLQPEKSTSFTLGMVTEPLKDVTASVDYFNIKIKNQISVISEADIFADPVKYAADFVRNADGSLNYITNTNVNLGNIHTSGFDLGFGWRLPKSSLGDFNLALDGTYITQYDYQTETGGKYLNNLAIYANGGPVFRWRHTATLNWINGPWGANLQQVYSTGYSDQNSAQVLAADRHHQVGSYTRYNVSTTYTGVKNLTLTAGIKNLLNTNPPGTNTLDNFQYGYDARYTDPIGRAFFVRANYKFF